MRAPEIRKWVVAATVVTLAVLAPSAVWAAQRCVLGEEFTASW